LGHLTTARLRACFWTAALRPRRSSESTRWYGRKGEGETGFGIGVEDSDTKTILCIRQEDHRKLIVEYAAKPGGTNRLPAIASSDLCPAPAASFPTSP
jgi:hypothetical protein